MSLDEADRFVGYKAAFIVQKNTIANRASSFDKREFGSMLIPSNPHFGKFRCYYLGGVAPNPLS
jgi:hypothetical protein